MELFEKLKAHAEPDVKEIENSERKTIQIVQEKTKT